jgi:hypothetical protein
MVSSWLELLQEVAMSMLLPSSRRRSSMAAHTWKETGLDVRHLSTAGSPTAALSTEAAAGTCGLLPCRAVISSSRNAPWSRWRVAGSLAPRKRTAAAYLGSQARG